ncbi:MAG TPA: hypothetical protein VFJ57_08160 [Solirubrobacterales bacterium]|nr:hypothetical protein [Solirubrobacterales bacterium]
MIAAVEELRAAGIRVVIVSNSYGFSAYRWELADLADAHLLSGAVGVAKPAPVNVDAARALGMEAILHAEAATTIAALSGAFGIELGGRPSQSPTRGGSE